MFRPGSSLRNTFSTRSSPINRFANHVDHRFVYTGTHDHDTARGFLERLGGAGQAMFRDELAAAGIGFEELEPWWSLISLALHPPARVTVMQAQDILGPGSAARMNDLGRPRGNWHWALEPGALTPALGRRLRELTEETGRMPA